jgi:hypothetical protein
MNISDTHMVVDLNLYALWQYVVKEVQWWMEIHRLGTGCDESLAHTPHSRLLTCATARLLQ